ncbi:MAG TPA: STAS domain-containing protein [Jatrophihabitans sp.]|nr:STAS domain-containing protein [Jatrophihabitans sp.]
MTTSEPDFGENAQFYADQARADTWVVTVIGEVDLANRDRFEAAVKRALHDNPARLVFDLAGVRFMDSSGLGVMLAAADKTASVEVRAPSSAIRRLIEVSGLTDLFRVVG